MSSPKIQKLVLLLSKLPGLGPRQATRLAYHILDQNRDFAAELAKNIVKLREIKRCSRCFQAHEERPEICSICSSASRDQNKLMVVEKDMDLETIEKTGVYNGTYFVLGGLMSPLREDSQRRIRLKELVGRVSSGNAISEIVLATSSTAEGDMTSRYIEKILEPHMAAKKIKLTRLGRGLSTGVELEYSDLETFKNAYLNRK